MRSILFGKVLVIITPLISSFGGPFQLISKESIAVAVSKRTVQVRTSCSPAITALGPVIVISAVSTQHRPDRKISRM